MKIFVLEFVFKNEIVGIYPTAFKSREEAEKAAEKEKITRNKVAVIVELTLDA